MTYTLLKALLIVNTALGVNTVAQTVTRNPWDLYDGTTIISNDVGDEQACIDAASQQTPGTYGCRTITHVTVDALPPPPPPPPIATTQWTGVPAPNGLVPVAIMPDIPIAANQQQAFTYDPITLPTPTYTNAANQYWVDNSVACDNNANGGRGDQATPRCALPGASGAAWTLAADSQVFVAGGNYVGNYDAATFSGTESQPIWIVVTGGAKFQFEKFFLNATHAIIDGAHFYSTNNTYRGSIAGQYVTVRNSECRGNGAISTQSRRCFSLAGSQASPTQFIVFYDVDFADMGRWQDDFTTSRDMHGLQFNKWVRYVWVLNSKIYHLQGDSIQCANSQWFDYDYAARPHYIYISGNEFYENYENGYDQKGCYHVVFSDNYVHDFYNAAKSANNTAIITEQDSEGDVGGRFTWFINNRVENTGQAFAAKATTSDAYIYILRNQIKNSGSSALLFTQRCYNGGSNGQTCPLGLTFAQNTVDCNLQGAAVSNPQNPTGSNQNVEIDGNIFYNCVDGRENSAHNWESFSVAPLTILHVNNIDYRTTGDQTLPTSRIDLISNETINQPITLGVDNYPSITGTVQTPNSAFDLFSQLYGVNIKNWTQTPINAGAAQ